MSAAADNGGRPEYHLAVGALHSWFRTRGFTLVGLGFLVSGCPTTPSPEEVRRREKEVAEISARYEDPQDGYRYGETHYRNQAENEFENRKGSRRFAKGYMYATNAATFIFDQHKGVSAYYRASADRAPRDVLDNIAGMHNANQLASGTNYRLGGIDGFGGLDGPGLLVTVLGGPHDGTIGWIPRDPPPPAGCR